MKATHYFFLLVFFLHFAMVFSLVKQINSPKYKKGLEQAAKIMTQNM